MSISVPQRIIKQSQREDTLTLHANAMRYSSDDRLITLEVSDMSDEAITEMIELVKASELNASIPRMLTSVLSVRAGKHGVVVPNLQAFIPMLVSYLKQDMIHGWLYQRRHDGNTYPALVTDLRYSPPDGDKKGKVVIFLASYTKKSAYRSAYTLGNEDSQITFYGEDVVRRNLYDILSDKGYEKETPELMKLYKQDIQYFHNQVEEGFSEQYTLIGPQMTDHHRESAEENINRKVLLNTELNHYSPKSKGYPIRWLSRDVGLSDYRRDMILNNSEQEDDEGMERVLPIPEHPVVEVFDLKTHAKYWVHSSNMLRYRYDGKLRDKIVLPSTHRDLLDILTTDIGAFIDDIIEGKSAGNVILCQGRPGVGKTLTAEIYSELIERPLYSVHSGSLGTTAKQIEENLKKIFTDAKRWNAVLLIDEADVFVAQRGQNIEQNAIVAEFLRTLEYFDGLMFMTTNRANDIDEAILSRCAAIIQYDAPQGDDLTRVWQVMSDQFQANLSDEMISDLQRVFPDIAPRDIKMLLRLALRVSAAHKAPLSIDTFRQCALFRSIKMSRKT